MKNGTLYVVEMLRFGDREMHSYVVGVYTRYLRACFVGAVEETWRGGKYEACITPITLDDVISEDKLDWYEQCDPDWDKLLK